MKDIILLVVLFLAFGCVQQQTQLQVSEQPQIMPANETKIQNQTKVEEICTGNIVQKDGCYLELAAKEKNPEWCKQIYSVDKTDVCYSMFANESMQYCEKVLQKELREICLTENAKKLKDEKICLRIEDAKKRASCLEQILPHCMLLNVEERPLCFALEKKDYMECQGDFACLLAYARNTSDQAACYAMKEERERYFCLAVIKQDPSVCTQASLAAIKDWCVQKSAEELDRIEACDLITAGTIYMDGCYFYFAAKKKDSTICMKASREEKRDECLINYAISTSDSSVCKNVIESTARISCYYKSAKENRMPSLCNPLSTGQLKRECYSLSIFSEYGPLASDCYFVENQEWKDKCFREAAIKSSNASLCDMISPGSDKDYCEDILGG
ncbi:MAG: hypothetical protein QXN37_00925 [Candidatus Anstonellaceae archaeon]